MLAAEIFYHNLNFIIPGGTSRGILKNKPTWYIKIYHNDNPSIFGLGECGPIQGLSIESGDKMMDQLKKVKESINDFLINSLRRMNRYAPWQRAKKISDIEYVKEYYGYSNEKAKSALTILSNEQIKYIKKKLNKGGRHGKNY